MREPSSVAEPFGRTRENCKYSHNHNLIREDSALMLLNDSTCPPRCDHHDHQEHQNHHHHQYHHGYPPSLLLLDVGQARVVPGLVQEELNLVVLGKIHLVQVFLIIFK